MLPAVSWPVIAQPHSPWRSDWRPGAIRSGSARWWRSVDWPSSGTMPRRSRSFRSWCTWCAATGPGTDGGSVTPRCLVGAALVPPLAWYLFTITWWKAHHFDVTYPAATSSLRWSVWVHNFEHLSGYVSYFAPALAPVAGVAVFLLASGIVLVMVLAVRRRSLALLLANCSLLVLILLALTSTSALEPGLYLAGSRILLPLPFAVWFLSFAVLETAKGTPVYGPRTNQRVIAVVVVATISVIVTQITFSSVATRSITPTVGVSVANPTTVLSPLCAALTEGLPVDGRPAPRHEQRERGLWMRRRGRTQHVAPVLRSPRLADPGQSARTNPTNPGCRTELQLCQPGRRAVHTRAGESRPGAIAPFSRRPYARPDQGDARHARDVAYAYDLCLLLAGILTQAT